MQFNQIIITILATSAFAVPSPGQPDTLMARETDKVDSEIAVTTDGDMTIAAVAFRYCKWPDMQGDCRSVTAREDNCCKC